MTEEIIIENAFHLCQRLEQENKDLKKQIESDKGLITVGGKQQYEYLQKINELEQENERLKDKAIHFEMANDIKKQEIDSLREYLERLEQERDELKKTVENQKLEYEELQCDLSEVENACGCYQSENAELKQENKELRQQLLEDKILDEEIESLSREDTYRSTLEEIREIAMGIMDDDIDEGSAYYDAHQIINKIDEVLS